MWRVLFAPVALCACVDPMVRAPTQIPFDGVVECTDSMKAPGEAVLAIIATLGVAAASTTHPEVLGSWTVPVVGAGFIFSLDTADVAWRRYTYAKECSFAKQRGAERARQKKSFDTKRAEANTFWMRAAVAARADDCEAVRELDPLIRELDIEFHDVVFARDVAIARCLAN